MREKRKQWKENQERIDVSHLVFLDESSVNVDMTRRYARAESNRRAFDHAPLSTPKATTVLSSIRMNGQMEYTSYSGGTTGTMFVDYLKNILFPSLKPGDIVVMDNMRSHHVAAVAEAFRNTGFTCLYLPPYSPDLNPIEKLWSKLKSILRSLKARSVDGLPAAITLAFHSVVLSDCIGWFRASDYCA